MTDYTATREVTHRNGRETTPEERLPRPASAKKTFLLVVYRACSMILPAFRAYLDSLD